MDQMEDRLPILLQRLAEEVPPPVAVPPELMRRSRRRILLNGVLTAAVVAGLAVGSVTIFRTLVAGDVRDRQVPASDPTPVVGKIAFPSPDGIYLVNNDGGGLARLTHGGFPSFSPDGTRIAFTRSLQGPETRAVRGQVYVMEADGTGISRLTDQAQALGGLAWSPDGTRIAFVGTRDGEDGLIIVNSDGGGTAQLVGEIPADDVIPSWSPDGGRILIGTGEGFHLVDVQTGATSLLPRDPRMAEDQRHCGSYFGPTYSPNGTTIAFAWWRAVGTTGLFSCRIDGLFLMDADGTNVRRLTLTRRSLSPWGPSWSPDGTRIAFFSFPQGGAAPLYVVNVDGSGLAKLADNTADITQDPTYGILRASPSWSPLQ